MRSPAARFLSLDEMRSIAARLGARRGDLLLIVAGPTDTTESVLGQLRREMGLRLNLADPDLLAFAFVVDFPLLEWMPDESRWHSPHNPFSSPKDEHITLLETDPGSALAKQYDLVCNGTEIAGGSVRNHTRSVQEKIFSLLGHSQEAMQTQFGQLLDALEYGAPPHGGFASGIDRSGDAGGRRGEHPGGHRISQDPERNRPPLWSAVACGAVAAKGAAPAPAR